LSGTILLKSFRFLIPFFPTLRVTKQRVKHYPLNKIRRKNLLCNQTAAEMQPIQPEAFLGQIAFGALMTQALYVAAKLGIADLLKDNPKPVSELAAATNTHEQALYRVLRSLASIGIFQESEGKTFALTGIGDALRSDAPNSMRNGSIFMGEAWHWNVWGNLLYSVKTGKPAWGKTHGMEVFDYFREFPEHGEIFNGAMTICQWERRRQLSRLMIFRASKRSPTSQAVTATCSRKF
jgi:hypothetical protein